MSRIVSDLQPGAIVYKPYSPTQYGKILEVLPSNNPYQVGAGNPDFRVKWKDGSVTRVSCLHVNSYDDLVESTERKLRTHRETLRKAQAL